MSSTDLHVYTSAKGDFLSWSDWVAEHGTEAEKAVHASEEATAEKDALYKKWAVAEQINSHIVKHEDGTETDMGAP
jgi:hypothetical protein